MTLTRRPISLGKTAHLLRQLNKVIVMRHITRCQQISNEEDNQNQFNNRSDWIILIARLNIADEHGRARHLLKGRCDLVHGRDHVRLNILKVHVDSNRVGRNHRRELSIALNGRLVKIVPASARTGTKSCWLVQRWLSRLAVGFA